MWWGGGGSQTQKKARSLEIQWIHLQCIWPCLYSTWSPAHTQFIHLPSLHYISQISSYTNNPGINFLCDKNIIASYTLPMPSVYIPLHIHKTSLGISDKSVSLKLQFNTFIKK